MATLTLVGAGPGDPELISLKGVKAIQQADVILYDALVHPLLLEHRKPDCVLEFVGKKVGVCQFKQEDINALIVTYAQTHQQVVRLKGGDPFIFGRGHEEIEYAKKHGISTQTIPGISSIYSVPELKGIPLTRRGYNESFWVVTGTTKDHTLSEDVYKAAQSNATIVILMGMKHLPQIVEVFSSIGKSSLPVAIIQNGSWENEKMVLGTIDTIEQVVQDSQIGSPAVIVIGDVVSLAHV